MISRKRPIAQFIIAVCGVFAALGGLWLFNWYLLMGLPLWARMVLMIVTQWMLFLVPGILMLVRRETWRDIGFAGENIPKQIGIGVVLAVFMSALFTVLPILLGFKEFVGDTSYTKPWQFAYQFVYAILGVALAEELIFRGYLFRQLLVIRDSRWFAIAVSSILFGLFHIFGGNPIQMVLTVTLGLLYCVCREKIRGCTLLSLIIAHGLYDAMIVLWIATI